MEKFTVKLSEKQKIAWSKLNDKTTNEILYGGGAGGGKSFLGCLWLANNCIKYPGTRWLMARAVLKALKESTLNTFIELINNLKWNNMVNINQIDGKIKFNNGSEIILKDLYAYPADPNFDALGSTEYTGAFIDEASQVTEKAKNIVLSRLRFKLEEFNLVPKLLITSNPAKNWMYESFYKPSKNNNMSEDKAFIQSLVTDNPNISPHYIAQLNKLDNLSKQRLLFGNWEYDDDLGKLFKYDNILNMWTNDYIQPGTKYLSCDVARMGRDRTVICYWNSLILEEIYTLDKSKTSQVKNLILQLSQKYSIPRSNIVIDEDGVGGGVVDELPGCKGFVNNSSALGGENYANLKSQVYFKLSEYVEKNLIYIKQDEFKDLIVQELEQVRMKDPDKDGKMRIEGKDKIKENIGRSPDFSDAIAYRMYFECQKPDSFILAKELDIAF
jgi:PBSX family phage terminase large subunit